MIFHSENSRKNLGLGCQEKETNMAEPEPVYKLYTYRYFVSFKIFDRWYMLISFTISAIASGFVMVGFSAVSTIISVIYDCGSLMMTLCTLTFLIAFIPMNFVVINCLKTRGLKYCLMVQAILAIIGGWSRQLIAVYPHFWIVLLGTIPIAVG